MGKEYGKCVEIQPDAHHESVHVIFSAQKKAPFSDVRGKGVVNASLHPLCMPLELHVCVHKGYLWSITRYHQDEPNFVHHELMHSVRVSNH